MEPSIVPIEWLFLIGAISYLLYRLYKFIIRCLEEDKPDYMSDEDKDELEGLW